MAIFKGAGVAIVTPMHEDGKVNYEKLEEILEDQIANSTDAIVICGTTGESSTLTHGEHLQTIKFTIDKVNKRVPVIAGTGSNCTETAIMMSKEAASYGADALLIVTPYYLAKNVKNIVGIKEATGDLSQIAKMMSLADGQLELYSGNDDQILPILSLGGLGVISVLSNVAPKYTHDMVMKYFDGDTKGAAEDQLKAIPLINALFSEVNPIPVKTAMNLMGMNVGPLRMPLCDMEDNTKAALAKEIEKFGLKLAE